MSNLLLYLDPDSSLNLQGQIRTLLIEAILSKQIAPGVRLPSTRQLAKQLGVSRNTVIVAVQELIADGYLISRERSGCYINEDVLDRQLEQPGQTLQRDVEQGFWQKKIIHEVANSQPHPANWYQYPYPFIEGQFDKALFPITEWRECARIVQGVREINAWAADTGDADDLSLVEQIRTKLLPLRGINAQADEILITSGSQSALALAAQLLISANTRVGVERPGYNDAAALFKFYQAKIIELPVDDEGLIIDKNTGKCDVIYTTPSHQFPTTVTMSMARRRELLKMAHDIGSVILEDDYAQETNFVETNSPALRSLDKHGQVIYVSSLSKKLAPGIRIGYMVASPEFIRQARALRRLTSLHPANNNQRTAALFLSLGHYDTLSRRLDQLHKQRWLELRQAVNYCFPQPNFMITPSSGGTACWIQGPEGLDVFELVSRAQQRGILLDSPDSYLHQNHPRNYFRLSITSIDKEKIRPGLEQIATIINEMLSGFRETLSSAKGRRLSETDINKVMPGSALIGKTAYGDAYTVLMHDDGAIEIAYDNASKETDTGRWWIENGQWWRQFTHSTYGEARGFYVVLEGNIIKWFDQPGDLVDTELFVQNYTVPETI